MLQKRKEFEAQEYRDDAHAGHAGERRSDIRRLGAHGFRAEIDQHEVRPRA